VRPRQPAPLETPQAIGRGRLARGDAAQVGLLLGLQAVPNLAALAFHIGVIGQPRPFFGRHAGGGQAGGKLRGKEQRAQQPGMSAAELEQAAAFGLGEGARRRLARGQAAQHQQGITLDIRRHRQSMAGR
jgi:hypothetical protein